jgi:hypothetical protein
VDQVAVDLVGLLLLAVLQQWDKDLLAERAAQLAVVVQLWVVVAVVQER